MFPNPSGNPEALSLLSSLTLTPFISTLAASLHPYLDLRISGTQVKSPFRVAGLARLTEELSKGILAWRHQEYKGSHKTMNKRKKKRENQGVLFLKQQELG